MIGHFIIGGLCVVLFGISFWREEKYYHTSYTSEKISVLIWIVGLIISLSIFITGIVLNEQAQAEYAKYEAVEWYGVLLEDDGDSALDELGESRELPDLDKIIFEVALKEGYAEKKEALCFIAKVHHHNRRYGIFSKYWLLRKKVTGSEISELL